MFQPQLSEPIKKKDIMNIIINICPLFSSFSVCLEEHSNIGDDDDLTIAGKFHFMDKILFCSIPSQIYFNSILKFFFLCQILFQHCIFVLNCFAKVACIIIVINTAIKCCVRKGHLLALILLQISLHYCHRYHQYYCCGK